MKFKMIAPTSLLCLGFSLSLVGCGNATNDGMTSDIGNDIGYGSTTDNGNLGNNTGYDDLTMDDNYDYGTDEFGIEGDSLSNQLNGIFGGYGIDGDTNTNSNNGDNNINGSSGYNNGYYNNNNSGLGYNNRDNDSLGFQYGYGDGLDTSIGDNNTFGGNYNGNYTSSRFGFGMPGAENIIGNGGSKYANNSSLNNSLMS